MSKKRKNIMENGKLTMSYSEIENFMNRHRVRILLKYVDREFINNPDFIEKIQEFMNGNIKTEIIQTLDEEYKILRDDPDDENITKMIDEKVEDFISRRVKPTHAKAMGG